MCSEYHVVHNYSTCGNAKNVFFFWNSTALPLRTNLPPALSYDARHFEKQTDIGMLRQVCPTCNARKFLGETKAFCCNNGKTRMQPYPLPPADIRYLFENENQKSKEFLKNIRKYNIVFQMTSLGCQEIRQNGWNPIFSIQGQLYHLHGSILPNANEQAKFIHSILQKLLYEQVLLHSLT